MNTKKRIRKGKTRGILGFLRAILIMFMVLLLCGTFWIIGIITNVSTINLIFVYLVMGTIYDLIRGNYYVRELTNEEYANILNHKLIHYTDYPTEDEIEFWHQTGSIQIHANGSARSNYSMKLKDKKKKYVWFHQSSNENLYEPQFSSFFSSNFTESTPRKYKIIVEPYIIPKNSLLIRPWDKAVVVIGNYSGPANIETEFNWYNKKSYWNKALFYILKKGHMCLYMSIHQWLGNLINWYESIKEFKNRFERSL